MPSEISTELLALSPQDFELVVADMFKSMGYEVERAGKPGDEGVDLRLVQNGEVSIVQCKRYQGTVGQPAIRDFFGAMQHDRAKRGFVVTTGMFSLAARTWAQGKPIALVDGPDLSAAISNLGLEEVFARRVVHRENSGVELRCLRAVEAGRRDPYGDGLILIDGAPPAQRRYEEVAEYLRRRVDPPGHVDWVEGAELRGKDWLWRWSQSRRGAGITFVNNLDGASQEAKEEIITRRMAGVLVATRWERRLPKVLVAKFSTVIPANEVEWEAIPTAAGWIALKEAEKKLEEAKTNRKAQREAKRLTGIIEKLRPIRGLYCGKCCLWFPVEGAKGKCSQCRREIRYVANGRIFQTELSGLFGTSWMTATADEVQSAKDSYIRHKARA